MWRVVVSISVLLLLGLAAYWGISFWYGRSGIRPLDPPAIAQNAQFEWRHGWRSEPKWTAMLKRAFPLGSEVSALEDRLHREGFKLDAKRNTAEYEWGGQPCVYTLRVDWATTADRKIASVNGGYALACL